MTALLAVLLAGVVVVRCVCVIHSMSFATRSRAYPIWFAFGVSYAVLCVASLGAAANIAEGTNNEGDWLWLIASAGLITFDRRNRIKTMKGGEAAQT